MNRTVLIYQNRNMTWGFQIVDEDNDPICQSAGGHAWDTSTGAFAFAQQLMGITSLTAKVRPQETVVEDGAVAALEVEEPVKKKRRKNAAKRVAKRATKRVSKTGKRLGRPPGKKAAKRVVKRAAKKAPAKRKPAAKKAAPRKRAAKKAAAPAPAAE